MPWMMFKGPMILEAAQPMAFNFQPVLDNQMGVKPSQSLKEPARVRVLFPESWLWDQIHVG